MKKHITGILFLAICLSCTKEKDTTLTAFKVYCEMVANDAKPMAFHYPMENDAIHSLWADFEAIARDFKVELFSEKSLPKTLLFPTDVIAGKTVVIIHKDDRLKQYQQWKADIIATDQSDFKAQEVVARRLGRLLGYGPKGINDLLMKNSKYRNLAFFEVRSQITHLYYENVEEALSFYKNTLGLNETDSNTFQISENGYITLHPFDKEHVGGEPKSTAIALLTDQLKEWYSYLQEQNIPIKYTYKPKKDGPHDGFVAIDPGGYLLEFEQFKQHPENEIFMAVLSKTEKMPTTIDSLVFYSTITWTYQRDLLKMQKFYEEEFGYRLVADQGWTKIYQTTNSSFIGLVDERRGMEDYADKKAVEIEWKLNKHLEFLEYSKKNWTTYLLEDTVLVGPEKYRYLNNPLKYWGLPLIASGIQQMVHQGKINAQIILEFIFDDQIAPILSVRKICKKPFMVKYFDFVDFKVALHTRIRNQWIIPFTLIGFQ